MVRFRELAVCLFSLQRGFISQRCTDVQVTADFIAKVEHSQVEPFFRAFVKGISTMALGE